MAKFQGFKNWNHWNVSLWINNDERLYRMAQELCSRLNRKQAAHDMVHMLGLSGITKTPDGAPYSVSAIKTAMRGM